MRDDELSPDEQDFVAQLRALRPEGVEPDWNELEKSIRNAVEPLPLHVPWWRRMRWLVPVGVLASTAAAALLWLRRPEPHAMRPDAAPVAVQPAVSPTTLWIDDQIIDVGELDDTPVLDDPGSVADGDDNAVGLLPAQDLGWVDKLDDGAAERAEDWLEKKKS